VIKAGWQHPEAFLMSSQVIIVMAANSEAIVDVTGAGSGRFI
jgi:hypothetical protein